MMHYNLIIKNLLTPPAWVSDVSLDVPVFSTLCWAKLDHRKILVFLSVCMALWSTIQCSVSARKHVHVCVLCLCLINCTLSTGGNVWQRTKRWKKKKEWKEERKGSKSTESNLIGGILVTCDFPHCVTIPINFIHSLYIKMDVDARSGKWSQYASPSNDQQRATPVVATRSHLF